MPSKSKAQQRFFGMVDAYKKGKLKNPSKKIKDASKEMTMGSVKDFAETKHKGLPEKVDENTMHLTETEFHSLIRESVSKVLNEVGITDIDSDNYYGGGLPDHYFDNDEDKPENDYLDESDIETLKNIASQISDIANNHNGDMSQLYDACQLIDQFIEENK